MQKHPVDPRGRPLEDDTESQARTMAKVGLDYRYYGNSEEGDLVET